MNGKFMAQSATSSHRAGISCQDSRQFRPALCKQMAKILQILSVQNTCAHALTHTVFTLFSNENI